MDRCDECGWQAEGGSCSLSDNDFVYCKLHGRISFKEKENSNVAEPNRYNVLADVPSLQEYLNWALEPEDGFRTHEEIYNYFARYFS